MIMLFITEGVTVIYAQASSIINSNNRLLEIPWRSTPLSTPPQKKENNMFNKKEEIKAIQNLNKTSTPSSNAIKYDVPMCLSLKDTKDLLINNIFNGRSFLNG